MAIALSLFAFYNYALAIDFPEIKVMQEAEHEFIDRENIDLWTLDDKERIKNLAMRFFVVDTAIFDHEDYIAAVNIPTYDYLTNYPHFFSMYFSRLEWLMEELAPYRWLLIISLISFISFLISYHKSSNDKGRLLRHLLFGSFYISVPFLINVMLIVPVRFLVPYIIVGNIILLIYCIFKSNNQRFFTYQIGVVTLAACLLCGLFFNKKLHLENQKMETANQFDALLKRSDEANKQIVIANLRDLSIYPSRLFKTNRSKTIEHYYLDFYIHSRHELYKKHHQAFFGGAYKSLAVRISKCANSDKIVFLSSEEYHEFLEEYLSIMHGMEYDFVATEEFQTDFTKSYELVPK